LELERKKIYIIFCFWFWKINSIKREKISTTFNVKFWSLKLKKWSLVVFTLILLLVVGITWTCFILEMLILVFEVFFLICWVFMVPFCFFGL